MARFFGILNGGCPPLASVASGECTRLVDAPAGTLARQLIPGRLCLPVLDFCRMIRDLEALLLQIPNAESRAFMEEAVRCYSAGAYRAAVVMAVAAAFDGIRLRLNEIGQSGGAPKAVATAAAEVQKKFLNQEAFEAFAIEKAEQVAELLTPAEAKKLRLLLQTRHLCAHPSGHRGSPEEARDAIAAVVELVLSRPAQLGMTAIAHLEERLRSTLFFPNPTDTESIQRTVATELKAISQSLLNALSSRLVNTIIKEASASFDTDTALLENATLFLAAMPKVGVVERQSVWRYAGRLIENQYTADPALTIIAEDPGGLRLADAVVRERAIALIRRRLETEAGRMAAGALVSQAILSPEEISDIRTAAEAKLFVNPDRPADALDAVRQINDEQLFSRCVDWLIANCIDGQFQTENANIDLIQSLPSADADRFTPDQRVAYILNVATAAYGFYASFSAKGLVENGLASRSNFLDSLKATLDVEGAAVFARNSRWNKVVELCINSGRTDIALKIVSLLDPAGADTFSAYETLLFLSQNDETKDHPEVIEKWNAIMAHFAQD